ncbi:hypothetical protein PFNF54_03117 [Plasmodium falciparum NF54]|uniref:Uncharacterized protein n=1 Tax=Plasmodium falciparum (isolate NF54) TaxID=5843 RepID=W7K4B1_PLAFO|nr:hypothetical protein PFNF54_03117 [Plasmodium falciparum NF54]
MLCIIEGLDRIKEVYENGYHIFDCSCPCGRKEILRNSNGPLDLPSGVTINLGLRRRKYSSNEPKNNTYLKNELNDDAKIIKDAINKTNFGKPEWDNNSVEEKLSYDFPPWLSEMISFSDKSKSTLGSLGVDNLPDLNECKNIKHFPKQMLCIIEGINNK